MTILGNSQARPGGSSSPPSARPSTIAPADRYVPLKDRLVEWWNGTANKKLPSGADNGVPALAIDIDDDGEPGTWSPARMKIAQDVYGEGFIEPGGAQFARKLMAPADADPSKTILDLSVGLGEPQSPWRASTRSGWRRWNPKAA